MLGVLLANSKQDAIQMEKTYPPIANPNHILLGPGPSMADPRMLHTRGQPFIGHLGPEFLKVMAQIQVLLHFVFQTKNALTLAVPGTGSSAMVTTWPVW